MNLLLFGHSGVRRDSVSKALVSGLASTVPRTGQFLGKTDEQLVPFKTLEDEIDLDILTFLDLDDRRDQQTFWNEAARRAIESLQKADTAKHRVLMLHATYYRQSQTWSSLNPNLFREMNFIPDMAITFIDDVWNVQNRLPFTHGSADWLSLREIITWRNVEISHADLFMRATGAHPQGTKNFVLGIRHPVLTAVEILLERGKPAIYAAHPISHVRKQAQERQNQMIEEIENDFKAPLRSIGPVLDPATIDELLLLKLREQVGLETITFGQDLHWPVTTDRCLAGASDFPETVSVYASEIHEAMIDVQRLVHFRDYRLMDQADCIITYRPTWDGVTHFGCETELQFAKQTGMPRLAWMHKSDPELRLIFPFVSARGSSIDEVKTFVSQRVKLGRRFKTVK